MCPQPEQYERFLSALEAAFKKDLYEDDRGPTYQSNDLCSSSPGITDGFKPMNKWKIYARFLSIIKKKRD